MISNAAELAQAQRSVELKSVPVEPRPAVTDEAAKRQKLEYRQPQTEVDVTPPEQDASYDDEGKDPDPDERNDRSRVVAPAIGGIASPAARRWFQARRSG